MQLAAEECLRVDESIVRHSLLRHSKDVFATMFGLTVTERLNGGAKRAAEGSERIISLIGFGGSHTGNCMISCSKEFACLLASSMLMDQHLEMNGEVMDVLSEISNMIFGNVKTELEEHLGPLQLSLPSVIAGRDLKVRSLANASWIVTPLTTGAEEFEACICVSAQPGKTSPLWG